MALFDLYNSKMANLTTIDDSFTSDNVAFYNNHFSEDGSYRQGTLIKAPDMTTEDIDFRVINIDKSSYMKKLYFRPNVSIKIGEYIKVKDKDIYYLVNEFNGDLLSPYATVTQCTQIFKYKGLPSGVIIPCYIQNSSYGSKGEIVNVEQESDFDSRGVIFMQKNKYTDLIFSGFRVNFNNSKNDIYEITKIITAYNSNYFEGSSYYQMICKYVKWVQGDDFTNGLAFNPKLEDTSSVSIDVYVNGSDEISIKANETYTVVNATNVTFTLDDDTISENNATIVSQDGTNCVVKALIPYKPVAIIVKDSSGKQIAIKNIDTVKYIN